MAVVAALCGPAELRTVRSARASVILRFEHQSVGRLELAVPARDTRAHDAIRNLRADPSAFAVIYALLARAIEVDGHVGRFRYELVHQLTHGPRAEHTDRSRLNVRVEQVLHVLSVATATWTAPTKADARAKTPRTLQLGALLSVDVVNRKARTVTIAAAARPLFTHYSLPVTPTAFSLARPTKQRRGPAAPILARLRLAALIAARWRNERAQRISLGDLLTRFAWVSLSGATAEAGTGASEAAGRALRPRLREAIAVLASELADPALYGAGLGEQVQARNRAALRTMLALRPVGSTAARPAAPVQPTLDDGRLRDVSEPSVFGPRTAAGALAYSHDESPDSLARNQDGTAHSLPHDHDRVLERAHVVTIGIRELADGKVELELGPGVTLTLDRWMAHAAGLAPDSLPRNHDEPVADDQHSLPLNQGLPACSPRCDADSLAPDHIGGSVDEPPPRKSGLAEPESFSDDSDRARGARLSAALAPPPAKPPPVSRRTRRRASPRAGPDDVDKQRRTA